MRVRVKIGSCLVILPLIAFAVGSGGAGAAGSGDTWTGTWSRSEDNVDGDLVLTQSGSQVTGYYTWNDGSGHVTGKVSGATFNGSFNESHYAGTFSVKLSGKSFTGSYSGENKDTGGSISGPFDGACTAGPCRSNGAASRYVRIPTPSGFGQAVSAPEPTPGGAATVESPPLGGSGDPVTVDVEGLSVRDQVIYNARHDCYVQAVKAFRGLAAVRVVNQVNAVLPTLERHSAVVLANLAACVATADALAKELYSTSDLHSARAARASCSELPIVLSVTGSGRHERVRSARFGDKHAPLKASCVRSAHGLRVTVAPRSKRVALSRLVGRRLQIGIVRARSDRAGGRLSVAFDRQ